MVKRSILIASGAFFLASAALAADSPALPSSLAASPFNWEGFYVGAQAGYGWSTAKTTIVGDSIANSLVAGGALMSEYKVGGGGGAGGLHMGHNWQLGAVVLGAEVDAGAMKIGKARSARLINPDSIGWYAPGSQFDSRASLSGQWQSTIRARVGVAFDRLLVYATGGGALANLNLKGSVARTYPVGWRTWATWNTGGSTTEAGYVVGAGAEYAMTTNLLVRVEGLYSDFGKVRDVIYPTSFERWRAERSTPLQVTTFRGGLSYKF